MRDHDIREILKKSLLASYLQDSDSKVVEELEIPVAKARIDIAVINGHFHGFEIKSAQDTLQRLSHQLDAYTYVFDYLTIVTESKYETKIINNTPSWVGVAICEDREIRIARNGGLNNQQQPFYIAKLLWREELLTILQAKKIKFSKSDRHWLLCECISDNLPLEEISNIVRVQLKNRVSWRE